ncbi:MAG: pilus assembly protein TadG-related protein, partial [Tepidisphaeraceae bacterium]
MPARLITERRYGSTLLYGLIAMAVLSAFVSLAVDYGRVQVTKTELQRAADAAARSGAWGMSTSISKAQDNAIAMAAANLADGSAVTLTASEDIEFGLWDASSRTFAALTGAARSSANAIRVTARCAAARGNGVPLLFGRVLGAETCDVRASSTMLRETGTTTVGFVGLSSVRMNGDTTVDAHDPSLGPYPAGYQAGSVASNGDITLLDSANVTGDAHPGIDHRVIRDSGV